MKNEKEIQYYKIYSIAFLMIFFRISIFIYPLAILKKLPVFSSYGDVFYDIFICFLFLRCISLLLHQIKFTDYAFLFLVMCVIGFAITSPNGESSSIDSVISRFILEIFPLYFLGVIININQPCGKHTLWYYIEWFSKLAVVLFVVYLAYYMATSRTLDQDNMSASYNILPFVILCIYFAFTKKSTSNSLFALIGVFSLIAMGTRGSIVCMAAFVIMYVLFMIKKTTPILILSILLIIMIVMLLYAIDYDAILNSAAKFLEQLGLSTRIIDFMQSSTFISDSNGRDYISETLIKQIKLKPFIGYGLLGGRTFTDSYAHNLAIELWVEYGVIFGSMLLILLGILIIRAFTAAKDQLNLQAFILMLTCVGVIKLFMSGTYISEPYLFLLVGVCVKTLRDKRRRKYENFMAM